MTIPSIHEITEIQKKYETGSKKSLGQNYCINPGVLKKIADSITADILFRNGITGIKETNTGAPVPPVIVEIGPGYGALTEQLLAKYPVVIAVEKDPVSAEILKQRLAGNIKDGRLSVITGDYLDVHNEIFTLAGKYIEKNHKIAVAGNLPYNTAATVIIETLEHHSSELCSITAMLQLESARRMTALPSSHEYGAISLLVQYYSDVKLLFKVQPGSFFPAPKVTSAVVKFSIKQQTGDCFPRCEYRNFKNIVKAGFAHRRKLLITSFRNNLSPEQFRRIENVVAHTPHLLKKRAQDCTLEEFITLSAGAE